MYQFYNTYSLLESFNDIFNIWASNFKCRLELNYLEIAFTTNGMFPLLMHYTSLFYLKIKFNLDRGLSPDNPSSKLVSSLLSDLGKSKLESESVSLLSDSPPRVTHIFLSSTFQRSLMRTTTNTLTAAKWH
jgi:hypothetical protein